MSNKPTVSVILATYNRAGLIGNAIESVVAQTFTDWELIVADDGSTDDTAARVAEWQRRDVRIKYLHPGHSGKIAAISNVALSGARGEFVAVLDDDDWWADPQKLEKQVAFLREHPDYVACGSGLILVDAAGKEIGKVRKPETDEAIRKTMLAANPIANTSSLFRRSIGGSYDAGLVQLADWDFWMRLGTKGKLYNFPEYFLAYRVWDKSISFTHQKEHAGATVILVRRYRNAYPGFWKAIIMAKMYVFYSALPEGLRKGTYGILSRIKKSLFSR